jgi:mono/diheme cytochrome c family protein
VRYSTVVVIVSVFALGILQSCRPKSPAAKGALQEAYGVEPDWNDPQHLIPLSYQQEQGKRVFYADCVWCHADSSPAGPSNRSNLNPTPALASDGAVLNAMSDEFLQNIITLGGSAMGKSAMMPPWGGTLTQEEIRALVAFMRAIAEPPYHAPARPGSQYSEK